MAKIRIVNNLHEISILILSRDTVILELKFKNWHPFFLSICFFMKRELVTSGKAGGLPMINHFFDQVKTSQSEYDPISLKILCARCWCVLVFISYTKSFFYFPTLFDM